MSEAVNPMQHEMSECLVDAAEMQQWLDTVKAWGQGDSPSTHKDICLHLRPLRDFLHKLVTCINSVRSTSEVLKNLPQLGQVLGRVCWIPHITADATSRTLLFQCLWGMYSETPGNAVEIKANQWIRKILCQLATDEEDTAQTLMKHLGVPPAEYHLKVLRKMLARLQEHVGKSCAVACDMNRSCLCDTIQATSEVCIPLVTCPEASSLIGALLQRPFTCVKAPLTEDFLDAIGSAYSCQLLSLEEQAVVSLWYHNLSSLEEAVLSLLETALANKSTAREMEQQIGQSLLPKACAQHCCIFLIINDIFRSALKQMEENEILKCFIKTFTKHFLRELHKQQKCVPLKAFFPQSPQCVLQPLLTQPSEMPEDAWRHHLHWLSSSLRRLTEEGEDSAGTNRGLPLVFEAWFLLVGCAHWVEVALQLLVTSEDRDNESLLWLLTFYHHPTNRGHHRDQLLVLSREVWGHMRRLFTVVDAPPPVDRCQILAALLSSPRSSHHYLPHRSCSS
uniref:FA complementation group C n=1 Tax=Neogobius melanostomus TaxID=47308 RepID=A0A8C6WQJ3_9GOBI